MPELNCKTIWIGILIKKNEKERKFFRLYLNCKLIDGEMEKKKRKLFFKRVDIKAGLFINPLVKKIHKKLHTELVAASRER